MTSSATLSPNQNNSAQSDTSDLNSQSDNKQHTGTCLKLKGSLVPMTVLELIHYDADKIDHELFAKTNQAPGFFENLPVIIDLEKLDENEHIPFSEFIAQCRSFSIKVVAIRGGHEHHQLAAKEAGLGLLAKQKERPPTEQIDNASNQDAIPEPTETTTKEVIRTETVEVVKTVIQNERQKSKIVYTPIRSGQQVYAAEGDLIILSSVSAGAEILADGNIHVYGALRGRALAGVKGDTTARIFCHSLEAELVSIAGQYKISEDIDADAVKKPAQVYLKENSLNFKALDM